MDTTVEGESGDVSGVGDYYSKGGTTDYPDMSQIITDLSSLLMKDSFLSSDDALLSSSLNSLTTYLQMLQDLPEGQALGHCRRPAGSGPYRERRIPCGYRKSGLA